MRWQTRYTGTVWLRSIKAPPNVVAQAFTKSWALPQVGCLHRLLYDWGYAAAIEYDGRHWVGRFVGPRLVDADPRILVSVAVRGAGPTNVVRHALWYLVVVRQDGILWTPSGNPVIHEGSTPWQQWT